MKIRRPRRLVKGLGLALAAAALAAPSAQAVVLVNDESGLPVSVQPTLYADDLHTALPRSTPVSVQPTLYADDLHAALPKSPVSTKPRGYAPINTRVRPVASPVRSELVSNSSTFDWGDAVIGAGFTFVLMGLGAAILAARLTRRSRLAAV